MIAKKIKNKGWSVVISALSINLMLGLFYSWSIFKMAIMESISMGDGHFNWEVSSVNNPYALACFMNALGVVIGGRIQDKLNPRLTAIIGGILGGTGLILSGQSCSYFIWMLGFGILTGFGIGIACAPTLPPALKWFPSKKTGLITGIITAGFSLASVYVAPLATFLISGFGLQSTMLIFGFIWIIVICFLSTFLVNPPVDFCLEENKTNLTKTYLEEINFSPLEMLRTKTFYMLWFAYAVGCGVGLMIIGSVASMAKISMGDLAWLVVVIVALGNTVGRFLSGVVSDKIGRTKTIAVMLVFQAAVMSFLLIFGTNYALSMALVATFVGFNYGSNLSLFPATVRDYFGMKNFGVNNGLLFSAWGVGGLILAPISQKVETYCGNLNSVYFLNVILLVFAAIVVVRVKTPLKEN